MIRKERCRMSNYGNSAMRTYYSSPAEVALAFCSSTSWIQARMPGASVIGWTNTGVRVWLRHSAHCRHWPPSASVRVWKHMRRSTHTQQFRRQKFLPRRYASAVYAVIMCPSVYPSVCPSVTSRSSTKMAKPRIAQTTPYDSPGTLVVWRQRSRRNSNKFTANCAPNRGGVGSDRRFPTNILLYLNTSYRW